MNYAEAEALAKKASPPEKRIPPRPLDDFHSVSVFMRTLTRRNIATSLYFIPSDAGGNWVAELKMTIPNSSEEIRGMGIKKSGDAALATARVEFNRELKRLAKRWEKERKRHLVKKVSKKEATKIKKEVKKK